MTKRTDAIFELISECVVGNQEKLAELLTERGFSVTQATVSRDIRRLGLVKTTEGGVVRYTKPQSAATDITGSSIFRDSVIEVDYALNTVVLKCKSGMAQAACTFLDTMNIPNVVGTIAGDDTIFVLMRAESDAKEFKRTFRK